MTLKIGTPNYSSNNSGSEAAAKTIYHRLGHAKPEQRNLVARIAPPVGELAEKGIWAVYVKQHFGYTLPVVTKAGEAKEIPVTFNCIERRDRNNNVVQRCPECDSVAERKAKFAEKKQQLMASGKTEQEAETALAFMKAWLKAHNLDKKWYMVAKNLQGQWGFLTISHTCYKLLKGNAETPGVIDTLVANKYDPLGEKGVWIKFTRTGTNWNEIKDLPSVYTESVEMNGETLQRVKTDTLTQADLDAIEKLPSLNMIGRQLSFDQIRMLVESGGSEEVVKTVLNLPTTQSSAPAKIPPAAQNLAPAVETMKPSPAPAPPPAAVDDEVARLQAQLAAAMAKKTSVAAPPPAPPPVGEMSPQLAAELDEDLDDFLAKYK